MSELKSYDLVDIQDYRGEVYLKSEADNVIADLEESHKKEVEQLLIEIVKLKDDYREACGRLQTANLIKDEQLAAARHHKYKWCLAMAEWCHEAWANISTPYQKAMWYRKWYEYWRELAEKFKEVK